MEIQLCPYLFLILTVIVYRRVGGGQKLQVTVVFPASQQKSFWTQSGSLVSATSQKSLTLEGHPK